MIINPQESYPVYLNLSPDDIVGITEQTWDTLRVLVLDDTEELCVATGYGNTHSTMIRALRQHKQTKRIYTADSIVYFEGKTAFINDTYSGEGERIPARKWPQFFKPEHVDMLRLLCTERGLSLT